VDHVQVYPYHVTMESLAMKHSHITNAILANVDMAKSVKITRVFLQILASLAMDIL
jgi:hypothetical protein